MKKLSLFVVILLALSICWAQNSASATYSSGDVQLVYHWENPTPPSPSQTPLSLNVSVPLGARITSVDVSYDIRTDVPNGAQNTLSYLECTSDGGTYETSMSSSNNAYSPVTVHFSRTGLNIANNVIGGGDISFTLHPFDEQGGWCISYVANNSFTVTVHYSDLFDLGEFVGQANGVGEVILNWQNNNNPANTLIVTNSVEEFVDPVDGVAYSVGDNIGTATVLYYGTDNQFIHTGVQDMTNYYYKAWATNSTLDYTTGISRKVTTAGNTVFPIIEDFESGIPATWSNTGMGPIPSFNAIWSISQSYSGVTPQSGSSMCMLAKLLSSFSAQAELATNALYFPDRKYSLSLWVYRNSINYMYDKLEIYVNSTESTEGAVLIDTICPHFAYSPSEATTGWYNYTYDLSEFGVGSGSVNHIIFSGTIGTRANGAILIDHMKIEHQPDFPENASTEFNGVELEPTVNLYLDDSIDESHPLITSLPNYDNTGERRVIGLTGFDNNVDIQAIAPAGNWYGNIYHNGIWHPASPSFISEDDVDRVFTFTGIDFAAKDGEVIILLNNGESATLPVTLSSFNAVITSENYAQLNWSTASESDLIGYNVLRATSDEPSLANIVNQSIIIATNSPTGADYSFIDSEVQEETYYYWLESYEISGETNLYGPVTLTIDIDDEDDGNANEVLKTTTLQSAYPNPFNPETTIKFSVRDNEQATLTIFNLKGQVMKTYDTYQAGDHSVVWDGKNNSNQEVPSGLYFYRLKSPSYNKTNKMVLMK